MAKGRARWSVVVLLTIATVVSVAPQGRADPSTRAWLDVNIPRLLERYRVPGAAVALVEDRKVTWTKGYGLADIRTRRRVSDRTVFQVASISKSLTAWGVVKLAEDGLIDLDAPVDRYLERWHLPRSPYNEDVTVRRVLSHTAGLTLSGYPGNHPNEHLPTVVDSLEGRNSRGIAVRTKWEPGKGWRYSGGGYTLLQLLVEDVTGQQFETYMKDAVLRPLGMTHSAYVWERTLRSSTARAYSQSPDTLPNYLYAEKAAAGLYTTAPDLARFAAAAASPSGNAVLNAASLRAVLSPAPATAGALGEYGYGVTTERAGGVRVVLHTGGNRGWSAIWMAVPSKREGIVLMTNSNTGALLYVDATCEWSRRVVGDVPQSCTALSGFRSFATWGALLGAIVMAAYLVWVALGLTRGDRSLRRPRGRWIRVTALVLGASVWTILWHTPIAARSLGLGLVPSIALPTSFRWISPLFVLVLLLVTVAAFYPRTDRRRLSGTARLVRAVAVFVAWIVFVYTDVASRIVFRTAGPRLSTQLSPSVSLAATALFLAVLVFTTTRGSRRALAS